MLHPLMFVIVVFNTGMTIVEWTFLMHEVMRLNSEDPDEVHPSE